MLGYLNIGTHATKVILASNGSSSIHVQPTPAAVARLKKQLYRTDCDDSSVVNSFLHSLWNSLHLQLQKKVILLTDATDSADFVCYVLRWISTRYEASRCRETIDTCPFSVYSTHVLGVNEDCVVVDMGYSMIRFVPIMYETELQHMVFTSPGIGYLPDSRSQLLEAFLAKSIAAKSSVSEQTVSEIESTALRHFVMHMKFALEGVIAEATNAGAEQVLRNWVLVGGGSHCVTMRSVLGYLLSFLVPDAALVWT